MTKRRSKGPGQSKRVAELLRSGLQLHQAGRLAEAEEIYREVLELDPSCADGLHLLALIEFHGGRKEEGIARLAEAVSLDGTNLRALNDLGNMRHEVGGLAEAERLFREIIRLEPGSADAHNSLGVCLKDQGNVREAVVEYQRAIKLQPRCAGYYLNLGNALKLIRDWSGAEAAFRVVAELAPTDRDAYRNLGIVLRHQDRLEEARSAFQRLLDLDPDNAVARHLVAACDVGGTPDRAASDYVREVFDEFADTFEAHLDQLGYDAPAWSGRVLRKHVPEADASLRILDAGCGTGLCGPILKPFARKLVGVDLSTRMLEKAQLKECYDELTAVDLIDYLRSHRNGFDVIVAADTFNYFGDLEEVFEASRQTLRDSGLLLFTLEHDSGETGQPYRLFPHGRFGHRQSYVTELLAKHHFSLVEFEEKTLRIEATLPVPGLFIAAQSVTSPESQ